MPHTITLTRAVLADGRTVDLEITDGRLAGIRPSTTPLAVETIGFDRWVADGGVLPGAVDLAGRLVLPPLVNGHVHLDKTFLGTSWQPHRPGDDVATRVAHERALRTEVHLPVVDRAAALVGLMLASGTGHARTHVDVDPDVGLAHLEAILSVRQQFSGALDLQVVAFPQSGILASPGVADLLDAALRAGADLVGGLDPAGFDGDAAGHLDVVFGLAERHGVGVDLHLHELGAAGERQLAMIADRTIALGLQGKVVVSHAYGLGTLDHDATCRLGEQLSAAGVAIMTNGPAGPMPPVLLLRDLGVTVFSGTDNVRDAWWPYGDGDMLTIARTVAYQQGFRSDADLAVALDLVTGSAARALDLPGYGLSPGRPADLVVVEVGSAAEAVASHSPRTVLRAGRPLLPTPDPVPSGTVAADTLLGAPTRLTDDSAVGHARAPGARPDPRPDLTPSRS